MGLGAAVIGRLFSFYLFLFLFASQNGWPARPKTLAEQIKALPVTDLRPELMICKKRLATTTLHVSLASDNDPGGIGDAGDLRYALNAMNNNLNTVADDHVIVFDFPMTIQLNGILPVINNSSNSVNITIGNSGSTIDVIIDGNSGAYPGFFIPMGNVTIRNIKFQNLTARGGNGGDGISGGGGGMGAGGAIFAPQAFLNGSNPVITLQNVLIDSCSAVGGNGGNCLSGGGWTGNEGAGGGGGFWGNGGSVTTVGTTGGAGGGGMGGDGGAVTLDSGNPSGGGGGGGGGMGSRATIGVLTNLGNGGSDVSAGENGNGYGLTMTAGSGGGGYTGANAAGGGGGGSDIAASGNSGGGGGGGNGTNGLVAQGSVPPGAAVTPSGGNGGDGAGGGGGGIVLVGITNNVDGHAGNGGYCGGGGGGSGIGGSDMGYTVQGGSGGVAGGGGGGGVDGDGSTSANGGDSLGGGGGGGGGPSNSSSSGGADTGSLGGGSGGNGANTVGLGSGGGGGGGGSGIGGAIFVDSSLGFTIKAFSGTPTVFNTPNTTTSAGTKGTGGPGGTDGQDGTASGDSIFLRSGSSLTLNATASNDLLTLGSSVRFTDDTNFGAGSTNVLVTGDGTVVYNGTTDYQGTVKVDNANFKVDGTISNAPVFVCRNSSSSSQRGKLSGGGTLSGNVFVNSGTISPGSGTTITLGQLTLSSANTVAGTIGSVVHMDLNSSGGTSLVAVTGAATLAGTLEIAVPSDAQLGTYTLLTSSGITGTFDSVTFSGTRPTRYTVSYLPVGAPTSVKLEIISMITSTSVSGNGTFTSEGGQVSFKSSATHNSNNQIVATLFYSDPRAGVRFDNPVVTTLNFTGNQMTMGGTARVNNQTVTFSTTMTDANPDQFSITLSNGYSASGSLTSGGVSVQ